MMFVLKVANCWYWTNYRTALHAVKCRYPHKNCRVQWTLHSKFGQTALICQFPWATVSYEPNCERSSWRGLITIIKICYEPNCERSSWRGLITIIKICSEENNKLELAFVKHYAHTICLPLNMAKLVTCQNSINFFGICSKVNQVIYSSSLISWPSYTPLVQIVFMISCWQVKNAKIFKGPQLWNKFDWICSKVNQVIYSSSPISWQHFKPLAQILLTSLKCPIRQRTLTLKILWDLGMLWIEATTGAWSGLSKWWRCWRVVEGLIRQRVEIDEMQGGWPWHYWCNFYCTSATGEALGCLSTWPLSTWRKHLIEFQGMSSGGQCAN